MKKDITKETFGHPVVNWLCLVFSADIIYSFDVVRAFRASKNELFLTSFSCGRFQGNLLKF